MPSIFHFEIPVDDPKRAKDFYTGLFGWKIGSCMDLKFDKKKSSRGTG
jgi:predicted enzyme related to lactoylglutathione lyase